MARPRWTSWSCWCISTSDTRPILMHWSLPIARTATPQIRWRPGCKPMKHNSSNPAPATTTMTIKTKTCPTLSGVMTSGAQTVALAPVFLASFEVGLWVDPDWRRQGAGATLLRHAVSQASPKSALIATVSTSNPSGPYMCRILHQCGFAPFAEAPDIRIWRKPA